MVDKDTNSQIGEADVENYLSTKDKLGDSDVSISKEEAWNIVQSLTNKEKNK